MPRYTPARLAEIEHHLARLSRDSLTFAQITADAGVTAYTAYNWKRRFGTGALSGERSTPSPALCADLVEISYEPGVDRIEIDAGDLSVRVPPLRDPSQLRAVLVAVRAC